MTRNSDNAQPLADSFIFVGPKGTTLPTDIASSLNVGFGDLGWLSDAGLGETPSTGTTVKRGINGSVIKTVRTDNDTSFNFECYERNALVMGILRPGSTPSTSGGITTTSVKSYLGSDERAWVLTEDFGTFQRRVAVARGQAFVTGTIQDKPGDLAVVQFRLDCYAASDGTKYIDITNNPAEAVS